MTHVPLGQSHVMPHWAMGQAVAHVPPFGTNNKYIMQPCAKTTPWPMNARQRGTVAWQLKKTLRVLQVRTPLDRLWPISTLPDSGNGYDKIGKNWLLEVILSKFDWNRTAHLSHSTTSIGSEFGVVFNCCADTIQMCIASMDKIKAEFSN
eukprot:5260028-Amphidinium_carterae.1